MFIRITYLLTFTALLSCASATGDCAATTMGNVVLSQRCQDDAAKRALAAHAQRQTTLGDRFGPFLMPWVSLRTYGDLFRNSGWSGPFEIDHDPSAHAPESGEE